MSTPQIHNGIRQVIDFPCPNCGVSSGAKCITKSGKTKHGGDYCKGRYIVQWKHNTILRKIDSRHELKLTIGDNKIITTSAVEVSYKHIHTRVVITREDNPRLYITVLDMTLGDYRAEVSIPISKLQS
jgi:hypothetical protein